MPNLSGESLRLRNLCWSPEPNSRTSNIAVSPSGNPSLVGGGFALSDISCDIAAGDRVAVVGPNGAGKTSLLRCMLGLREISSGQIELANKPLQQWSVQQRAGLMSYVPQQTNSEFALRVYDVVHMGRLPLDGLSSMQSQGLEKPAWWQWQRRLHLVKQQITQALKAVGMENTQHRLLNSLSGGELQRVLIARALVQQAKILVLDEPTNHLDVFYQHQILALLKSLHLTVVLTIHDLNLAAQYCNKVMLMNNGKLLAYGTPADVLTSQRLSDVFRLPCEVHLVGEAPGIPSICFHPEADASRNNGVRNSAEAGC